MESCWRYVGASVKGTSHAAGGTPCQDSCLMMPASTSSGESILVLCVADGAGGAAHAEKGSWLACSTFVELVISYLGESGTLDALNLDMTKEFVAQMVARLGTYAYGAEATLRDLACTFLGTVIGPSAVVCVQIGDGAIVLGDADSYRPVFWPQSGEYANTTYFLTDDFALDRLQFSRMDGPIDDVALLSDGLQMLALTYATQEVHVPFFRPLFQRLSDLPPGEADSLKDQLVAWLESPSINARTDDDKTLVLATRRSSL